VDDPDIDQGLDDDGGSGEGKDEGSDECKATDSNGKGKVRSAQPDGAEDTGVVGDAKEEREESAAFDAATMVSDRKQREAPGAFPTT
jgi:hypothetical protein